MSEKALVAPTGFDQLAEFKCAISLLGEWNRQPLALLFRGSCRYARTWGAGGKTGACRYALTVSGNLRDRALRQERTFVPSTLIQAGLVLDARR